MQSGAHRLLDIDAPDDRDARQALVRVGVVAHQPLVANAIAGSAATGQGKQSPAPSCPGECVGRHSARGTVGLGGSKRAQADSARRALVALLPPLVSDYDREIQCPS
jgi:hypothetical protein